MGRLNAIKPYRPTNTGLQRDVSVSYNHLGDLMLVLGDGIEAEQFCRAALAIAERLAATDPKNTGFQRDLSSPTRGSGTTHAMPGGQMMQSATSKRASPSGATSPRSPLQWSNIASLSGFRWLASGNFSPNGIRMPAIQYLADAIAILSNLIKEDDKNGAAIKIRSSLRETATTAAVQQLDGQIAARRLIGEEPITE
jgi:hypothetical protein